MTKTNQKSLLETQRERPIVFTGESVRAILDERKTQTRRVIHPQPTKWHTVKRKPFTRDDQPGIWSPLSDNSENRKFPYGEIGDRLWVKETWMAFDSDRIHYRADFASDPEGDKEAGIIWKSGRFMPRTASRITLEITEIRAERVQEISAEDARAEGDWVFNSEDLIYAETQEQKNAVHRRNFRYLWDSINGKTHPWESNPWVWVISFHLLPERN